jgi:cysteinyl-tRNA synthetase
MQLNFSFQGLEAARNVLQRLADFIQRLRDVEEEKVFGRVDVVLEKAEHAFKGALADDLNISLALAALFDMMREVNILIDEKQLGRTEAQKVIAMLHSFDSVLGVLPFEKVSLDLPQELIEALDKRNAARQSKNWQESDRWRDFITAQGYLIEDTPHGSRLKKVKS